MIPGFVLYCAAALNVIGGHYVHTTALGLFYSFDRRHVGDGQLLGLWFQVIALDTTWIYWIGRKFINIEMGPNTLANT